MLKTIETEQMAPTYLTQLELAVRWRISPRTLERWRWAGDGPRFIKIGGLVRYRLEDIEGFEAERLRQITGTQQPELAAAERIAPPVRSERKKSAYAVLRSFLCNGRRSVSPQCAATRVITQYYDELKLWFAEDLGVLNLTSIDGAAAAPSRPTPATPDEVTRCASSLL